MKKTSKLLMKKICSFCVVIAMVLSVAGSPVAVSYASELEEDAVILDEDTVEEETDVEKGTPTDASIHANTPVDGDTAADEDISASSPSGTLTNAGIMMDPALNGAPTDIEIDLVDITVTVPKSGEINPTPIFTNNGVGYTVEIVLTDGYAGWKDPGGNPISEYEKLTSADQLRLMFAVTPEPGYTLTTTTAVAVNGSQADINLLGGDIPAQYFDFWCHPQLDGIIDTILLPSVATVVGQKVPAYSSTGANYNVTGTWYVYDAENKEYKTVDETHTFADGNIYKLILMAEPIVGYEFSRELNVNTDIYYGSCASDCMVAYVDYIISFATVIDKVNISEADIPKAQIGKTFEDKPIEIPVPEGSGYEVFGYWTDEDGNRSGTFQNGNAYEFNMEIHPEAGYSLSTELELYIDEQCSFAGYSWDVAYHSVRQSFVTVIDKVYVSNLPVAVVGEAIKKGEYGPDFLVEVPADANYTAYAWWGLSNGEGMTEDTFQSGKSYDLYVHFEPKDGYEFSDSLIVNADGTNYGHNGSDKSWAMYIKSYSFRKVIDKLQVDGVKMPIVGEKASVDTLKVPDGANYVISSAVWRDYNTGELATTFENGHEYFLDIFFRPKDGYEFELYADVTVDGENYSDRTIIMPDEAHLAFCYTSFETLVSEVKVDNVPEMKVGEKATVAATVPVGVNYGIVHMAWYVWSDERERFVEFTGTFEAGEVYQLNIYVTPNEGYKFDEDATVIYINGAIDESIKAYEDGFDIPKTFTNGSKVIDRVEFTVAEPVVGHHSSIPPQIIVPEGANYYVSLENRRDWLFEKNGRYNSFYGYFDENASYGVRFMAVAKDGYVFAEDLVVVVNGVALSQDNIDAYSKELVVDYYFDAECDHIYSDWSDVGDGTHVKNCQVCGHKVTEKHVYTDASGTKCSVCGAAKNDGSPRTSDASNVMNIFALMAMCGIGILAVDRRKKKNN